MGTTGRLDFKEEQDRKRKTDEPVITIRVRQVRKLLKLPPRLTIYQIPSCEPSLWRSARPVFGMPQIAELDILMIIFLALQGQRCEMFSIINTFNQDLELSL